MKLDLQNCKVSRWTKGNQDRLYVKRNGKDVGYIDLAARRNCLKTTGRDGMEREEMEHVNAWLESRSEYETTTSTSAPATTNSNPFRTYNAGNGFYGSARDNARGYDGIE